MSYFKFVRFSLSLFLLLLIALPAMADKEEENDGPKVAEEDESPSAPPSGEAKKEESQPKALLRDASHPDAWKGLTKEEIERIKKGEVIIAEKISNDDDDGSDGARGYIQAAFVVDQPLDVVWRILQQTESQDEFLPHLDKCELVFRKDGHDGVIFTVSVWPFEKIYKVLHDFDEKVYHSHFYLDKTYDNDLNEFDGHWWIYADGDKRTLMRYNVYVNMGWFIPGFLERYLIRNDLPEAMGNVKRRHDSSGIWTKPDYEPPEDD